MEGEDRHYDDQELGSYGYTKQEVSDGEFVNVEEEEPDFDEFLDADLDMDIEE